jgi:hypothetical protein
MQILKTFLSLSFIFILAFCFLGFFLPKQDQVIIEKSLSCQPSFVYQNMNDLNSWSQWTVWNQKDPNMVKKFGDTIAGLGAHYSWKGNYKVGEGRIEIAESIPNQKIKFLLDFGGGYQNISEVIIAPEGSGTRVKWSISLDKIENPIAYHILGGYQSVLMKFMVSKDYDESLKNLENLCK